MSNYEGTGNGADDEMIIPGPSETYLIEAHNDPEVGEIYLLERGYERPVPRFDTDLDTDYHITWAVARTERKQRFEGSEPGDETYARKETNAEHVFFLIDTALVFMEKKGLRLDVAKVVKKLSRHDRREGYYEDIPIFDKRLAIKPFLELAAGLLQDQDSRHTPDLSHSDKQYSRLDTEEDMFCYAWDSYGPLKLAQYTGLKTQRESGDDFFKMVRKTIQKTIYHPAVLEQSMKELVIIGDMWHEHGCRPFKGDPAQIIKAIAEEVFNERMEAQRRLGEAVSKVTFLADYRKSKDDKTPPPSPTSPGGASGGYESGLSAMQANPAA